MAHRIYFEQRFSLCCVTCRKRTAVPTLRFFGRRWYPSPLFLFISLLQRRSSMRRLKQIEKRFGLSIKKNTWKRWCLWWQAHFTRTVFWKKEQGKYIGRALLGPYPKSLFKVMQGLFEKRMLLLLQFFAPITAGFLRAV